MKKKPKKKSRCAQKKAKKKAFWKKDVFSQKFIFFPRVKKMNPSDFFKKAYAYGSPTYNQCCESNRWTPKRLIGSISTKI